MLADVGSSVSRSGERDGPRVLLVHLDEAGYAALAAGDVDAAAAAVPVPVTAYALGPAWRSTWQRRLAQVRADPAVAAWLTALVWDQVEEVVVGRAGFHDRPHACGMVEVGYAVDPLFRRRGYARTALGALLARAAGEPSVVTVRASVAPDNIASTRLVVAMGFTLVGEQWDAEDGRELVYEREARCTVAMPASTSSPPTACSSVGR